MTIIAKLGNPQKGLDVLFVLNKSVLAAVASVVADTYFSDMLNWSEVLIYYKSSEGNQREIIKFDATQESPATWFSVSQYARDVFEVQKIVIKDFDGGSFVVQRTELVAAEFDVDMSGGGGSGVLLLSQEVASSNINITPSTTNTGLYILTPSQLTTVTGIEFDILTVNGWQPDTKFFVNLKNESLQVIESSDLFTVEENFSGFARVNFSGVELNSSSSVYIFEIIVLNCTSIGFGYKPGTSFDGGMVIQGSYEPNIDPKFRLYGNQ